MRSGHRSAHVKVVAASAILAAAALICGWSTRASRPVPEDFSVVRAEAADKELGAETVRHQGDGS